MSDESSEGNGDGRSLDTACAGQSAMRRSSDRGTKPSERGVSIWSSLTLTIRGE